MIGNIKKKFLAYFQKDQNKGGGVNCASRPKHEIALKILITFKNAYFQNVPNFYII